MPPVAAASTPAATDRAADEIAVSERHRLEDAERGGVQRVTDAAERVDALGQLTDESDLLDHLPGVGDDPRRLVAAGQPVAPGRLCRGDRAGHDHHRTPQAPRRGRGVERPRAMGGLDHDSAAREGGDDAVAQQEPGLGGSGTRRELRHENATGLAQSGEEGGVPPRVRHVDAESQRGDRDAFRRRAPPGAPRHRSRRRHRTRRSTPAAPGRWPARSPRAPRTGSPLGHRPPRPTEPRPPAAPAPRRTAPTVPPDPVPPAASATRRRQGSGIARPRPPTGRRGRQPEG